MPVNEKYIFALLSSLPSQNSVRDKDPKRPRLELVEGIRMNWVGRYRKAEAVACRLNRVENEPIGTRIPQNHPGTLIQALYDVSGVEDGHRGLNYPRLEVKLSLTGLVYLSCIPIVKHEDGAQNAFAVEASVQCADFVEARSSIRRRSGSQKPSQSDVETAHGLQCPYCSAQTS
ncbi:hypothetical protein M407DRAFT_9279 [Tulasnella calospora MUT 4182]|uniref:Uncharacterized protein n=1 Tax=Tulasnella calospora MUT 4182 TaxID=1051891 RepID=A0A0C3KQR0_9AGAM|nr:hypothetical protein M407DRAFT_9279 [Tulasnella calospora MUT 4182]